jgi:ABC-type oligopeptide transport system ATPase subunit
MTPLVQIRRLSKNFSQRRGFFGTRGTVHAVREVSLEIAQRETLGIVGESGCGKSTLGRMAVGLLDPSGGDVLIKGEPLYDRAAHADYGSFRKSLAGVVQMVFQDPYSSLNPRMRIGESVAEPLRCSRAWLGSSDGAPAEALIKTRVLEMLERVGLDSNAATRYPHEFSGGQRQRIAIARALVTRPAFVVCDEPTSSLDASVQSQVLNLLRAMQDELGLTYCFISHDLAVIRHMSDRVAVMYKGFLVEEGNAEDIFDAPCHPYTRLLLASVPGTAVTPARQAGTGPAEEAADNGPEEEAAPGRNRESAVSRNSDIIDTGCAFAPRCPQVFAACRSDVPPLIRVSEQDGRLVRCRLFDRP